MRHQFVHFRLIHVTLFLKQASPKIGLQVKCSLKLTVLLEKWMKYGLQHCWQDKNAAKIYTYVCLLRFNSRSCCLWFRLLVFRVFGPFLSLLFLSEFSYMLFFSFPSSQRSRRLLPHGRLWRSTARHQLGEFPHSPMQV